MEKENRMKDIEDIIISKRFFELTPAELDAVKDYASNEEDYDAMRWFLQSTKTAAAESMIEPSPSLRKNVLAHLHEQKAPRTFWLNGVGTFLFPTEKKFYRYPAFQMAAVAVVLVGFVFLYDASLNNQKDLALNETTPDNFETKETWSEKNSPESDAVINDNLPEESITTTSVERDQLEKGSIENKKSNVEVKDVYREFSVAEEVRYFSSEQPGESSLMQDKLDLESESLSEDVSVADETVIPISVDAVSSKSESSKNTGKDKKTSYNRTISSDDDRKKDGPAQSVPAGNSTFALSKEKSTLNDDGNVSTGSGTLGGAVESSVVTDQDNEERNESLDSTIPAKQFSINQTKELMKLFFIVK